MLRSLKNDLVALEYPINYFISQCIHNGEVPYWFNTWAMGFPLQSNLTWGIFSTPQIIFCSVFNYNIYTLHIEFIFFVLMAGWGMFHLLKKYFLRDERITVLLACCYMLSGFIVGAGQWMLYVTASAFIPVVLSSLLQLFSHPSFKHALLFAVLYFMMFTSAYAALNIITTYCLIIFTVSYIFNSRQKQRRKILLKYIFITGSLVVLFCLPCFLYSLELLKHINRGNPISDNTSFFNSNYLHPYGLSSMLFPFSSVKMSFPNTEGTMLNTYMGLFVLLALPTAISKTIKEKNRVAFILLLSTIFFLMVSFGPILPIRNALNVLPGFSYFRNSAIIRSYFIFFLIIYLSVAMRNWTWENILSLNTGLYSRILKLCFSGLICLSLIAMLFHYDAIKTISFKSLPQAMRSISFSQAIFVSAVIQLFLLGTIIYSVFTKRYQLTKLLFAADLIMNSLLCMPYFVVSSYSPTQVNAILHSIKRFPLQSEKVNEATTTYIDEKLNVWNNVNVFYKQVSANKSYKGPLALNNFSRADDSAVVKKAFNHPVIFAANDSIFNKDELKLIIQRPTHIRAQVNLIDRTTVTVMQNYFPGWKAYYNNKPIEFINKDEPGLTIAIPKGTGTIDYIYSKKMLWITALLLHIIVISFLILYVFDRIKRNVRFNK